MRSCVKFDAELPATSFHEIQFQVKTKDAQKVPQGRIYVCPTIEIMASSWIQLPVDSKDFLHPNFSAGRRWALLIMIITIIIIIISTLYKRPRR